LTPATSRYVALLRGINVGGHRIKMDELRALFEEMGLDGVETFIASGNVIFETGAGDPRTLAGRIETHLHKALGYEVATFLRTPGELSEVVAAAPSAASNAPGSETSVYVVFLPNPADSRMQARFHELGSEMDTFFFGGREVYWRIAGKLSESPLFRSGLAKATGDVPSTTRNLTTLRKLADKYPG
jgi:uncharacterized protein (DUF1697 family)